MRVTARRVTAGSMEIVPRVNSVELTPREPLTALATSYTTYEFTWNGSWSISDINTLEVVFGATGSVRVTAVEAVVTSTSADKTPYHPWPQRGPVLAQ